MNQQTLEKMNKMKLSGMARAFRSSLESNKLNDLTADELISFLIESEWDERYNRRLNRSITNARFRYKASIEQLYYDNNRLDKNLVLTPCRVQLYKAERKHPDNRKHRYREKLPGFCHWP